MTITCENICKSYDGRPVLRDVSFEVCAGSFQTLLGPTGAGKTTLLRILAGIEPPDSGVVRYDGVDLRRLSVRDRGVAFVYQRFVNYPSLTVYENIASPLRVARPRVAAAEVDRKVREVAELLGLSRVLEHLPEEVSGGQQQRCAIGRALAKGANHVFLDEPLANLDYKLREELRSELKRIFQARSGSVVYATPDPVDVLMMATHVGVLLDGRLVQSGETRTVYQNPTRAEVAGYFSYPAMNLWECTVERDAGAVGLRVSDALVIPIPGWDACAAQSRCVVGVRPHHLSLSPDREGMVSFRAITELTEVVGSSTELHLRHGGVRAVLMLPRVRRFGLGEELTCYLDPRQVYLFEANGGELLLRMKGDRAWQPSS